MINISLFISRKKKLKNLVNKYNIKLSRLGVDNSICINGWKFNFN